jgi:hypothetical protein
LRDSINSDPARAYRAAVQDSTVTVTRIDGATLAVSASSPSPGTATIAPVQVYASPTITLSDAVTDGATWSVMLNGVVYTVIAGADGSNSNVAFLDVTVVDDEVAGVLVRESKGSTHVIEPTDGVVGRRASPEQGGGDGRLIHVAVTGGTPAISGSAVVTNQGNAATQLRITISGNNSANLYIALSGTVSSDDFITLKLTPASGTERVLTYDVLANEDLSSVAAGLKSVIDTAVTANQLPASTVATGPLTQFVGDLVPP